MSEVPTPAVITRRCAICNGHLGHTYPECIIPATIIASPTASPPEQDKKRDIEEGELADLEELPVVKRHKTLKDIQEGVDGAIFKLDTIEFWMRGFEPVDTEERVAFIKMRAQFIESMSECIAAIAKNIASDHEL